MESIWGFNGARVVESLLVPNFILVFLLFCMCLKFSIMKHVWKEPYALAPVKNIMTSKALWHRPVVPALGS